MARTPEVTPDGWIVNDLRVFRILTEDAPPRRWSYWDQIRCDVHEPKIILMWVIGTVFTATGIGLIVAAVITGQWLLLLGTLLVPKGLKLLSVWVRLCRVVVRMTRVHPVATGVIEELRPHPILSTIFMISRAIRPSGEPVDVAVEVLLAQAIDRPESRTEVWFVDDPTFEYRTVFAVRPLT